MRRARPDAALEEAFRNDAALLQGETVLAAVSGGSDSVALAALLAVAAGKSATVVLAHVNHALRESAWQDEGVVVALGTALGLDALTATIEPGVRSEERLRNERYAALAEVARSVGAGRIFTAHHAYDQTETVLLALFRGAGPRGLSGMPPQRPLLRGLRLVRPLLGTEPRALRDYVCRRQLPFALDRSNADPAYRRNVVRAALADVRAAFPHLDAAVARCARIAREERDGAPRARLREALRRELGSAAGTSGVTFERLDTVAAALERGARGRHHLCGDLEVVISKTCRPRRA